MRQVATAVDGVAYEVEAVSHAEKSNTGYSERIVFALFEDGIRISGERETCSCDPAHFSTARAARAMALTLTQARTDRGPSYLEWETR